MARSTECFHCGNIIYLTDRKCPYCGNVSTNYLPKPEEGPIEKNVNAAYIISITGIFMCWIPIFGLVLPILAIILSIRGLNIPRLKGKARTAFILGLISLLVAIFMIRVVTRL